MLSTCLSTPSPTCRPMDMPSEQPVPRGSGMVAVLHPLTWHLTEGGGRWSKARPDLNISLFFNLVDLLVMMAMTVMVMG